MKKVGKSATILQSQLSKQIATNDNAAASEQEVKEQIEEDSVENAARKNRSGSPAPFMRNKPIEAAGDAIAIREEVEEQAEESRIDKVAFEDGVSTTSAKEYIRGRTHE